MNIWVIGNGESRKSFALNQLRDHTIGCNAVHRDYTCTEFVAVDMRMVNEILTNDNNAGKIVYTRPDWVENYSDSRVRILPDLPFTGDLKADHPFHWNSGPYAVLLAALYNPNVVNLLGFDLWSNTSFVNNIYKGTQNYSASNTNPVSPDFWIYQLGKIFNYFPHIHFVQHQKPNWRIPDSWKAINNLTIKYISV